MSTAGGEIRETVGDLLTVEADYIVHQANCLTVRPHGLAAAIFAKWPEVDCYTRRRAESGKRNVATAADRPHPGTIQVDSRVVHLFAQWTPGKAGRFEAYPMPPSAPAETDALRVGWFANALCALETKLKADYAAAPRLRKYVVAFPRLIGCDLAGGDWSIYRSLLVDFALRVRAVADVLIVKLLKPDPGQARFVGVKRERSE
jgi:O-acetyl-ADP-ribose deacetylase (regulator of RNase III)